MLTFCWNTGVSGVVPAPKRFGFGGVGSDGGGKGEDVGRQVGEKGEARQPAEVVRWTRRRSADGSGVGTENQGLPRCGRRQRSDVFSEGLTQGRGMDAGGQPKRAASKPGEAGSSQRGVCYSSRRVFAKAKIQPDRLTHFDDDATLLLPCILHSPYTFLESSDFLFQTG